MPFPLLDVYLAPGQLSLLAGANELTPTLLVQIARDAQRGRFLDLLAKPNLHFAVADMVGSGRAIQEVLDQLEVEPPIWRPRSQGYGGKKAVPVEEVIAAASNLLPEPSESPNRLILLHGLSYFYPANPVFYGESATVVDRLQDAAHKYECAILASTSLSGTQRRHLMAPRRRVYGSHAWTDRVEDVFVLDYPGEDFNTRQYRFYATRTGREDRSYMLSYDRAKGFVYDLPKGPASIQDKLYQLLDILPAGVSLKRSQIEDYLNPDFPVSRQSWDLWFQSAISTGALMKANTYGHYYRPLAPDLPIQ